MKKIKNTLFYFSVTSGFTVLIVDTHKGKTIGKIKGWGCFRHRATVGMNS
jgi:hypothetical protein